MKPTALLISRRLLQADGVSEAPATAVDVTLHVLNNSTTSADRTPLNSATPFDSSMALTVLVLFTALFFIGFFSVYIRRYADEDPSPPSAFRGYAPSSNEKRGLDPSAVSSLPLEAYGKGARHPMIDDCPICLGQFQDSETVKLIPFCGHVFHPGCVDTWLSSHVTCPLCRSAQLFKSVEEVCLDVKQEKKQRSAGEIGETSAVDDEDTWRESGVRRTSSCCELANQTVLRRNASF